MADRHITKAMREVEKAGGSQHLTRALTLLVAAREAVADHYEGIPYVEPIDVGGKGTAQIFAYTGPTAEHGQTPFVQVFQREEDIVVSVRDAYSWASAIVPNEKVPELGGGLAVPQNFEEFVRARSKIGDFPKMPDTDKRTVTVPATDDPALDAIAICLKALNMIASPLDRVTAAAYVKQRMEDAS